MIDKLNTIRSRNLPTWTYWQSLEQMQRYGVNLILGACDMQMVFRLNDNASAQWMSDRIGAVDVTLLSESIDNELISRIDCPVTGVPDIAAAGALVLNVGAEPDDLEAARPLLDDLADEVFHLGPPGTGTAFKLVANLLAAVQIAGVAEALAVAAGAGLDLDRVAQALTRDQTASRLVTSNVRRMADDHHDRDLTFPVSLRRKDTAYGVGLAKEFGVESPFAAAALAAFDKMGQSGWDDLSESKIFDLFRGRRP